MTMSAWNKQKAKTLYDLPFNELLYSAHSIHKQHFNAVEIELCSLLSIKTGACPEDCAYCPQSGHYKTSVTKETLLSIDNVISAAKQAKEMGATRFCMGAAWRSLSNKNLPKIIEMITCVKKIGLETCMTLGMLDQYQAQALQEAGLDFYNHNLDTSAEFYPHIISTHTHEDRLNTLQKVSEAGMKICCGGILGMGESCEDRIALLVQLANLVPPPQSIPINQLIRIPGTPLNHTPQLDSLEFIRIIALARIMIPNAVIRLSAGRSSMSQEMQALCFFAGANSMWLGDKLLTTTNSDSNQDMNMLKKLGLKPKK